MAQAGKSWLWHKLARAGKSYPELEKVGNCEWWEILIIKMNNLYMYEGVADLATEEPDRLPDRYHGVGAHHLLGQFLTLCKTKGTAKFGVYRSSSPQRDHSIPPSASWHC